MAEALELARRLASRIRFGGDRAFVSTQDPMGQNLALHAMLYQSGIELSEALTPDLWRAMGRACERLGMVPTLVAASVYASADVQAYCISTGENQCHLRFSSGLVDLLDEAEFEFVVGHEIGHFLLEHHRTAQSADQQTAEFFIQLRSQEISVDRIGLIACASLQVALRALMKTVSGLSQRHMRFDIGAFIHQVRKMGDKAFPASNNNTHPPIVIRSRALLWFSLSEVYMKWPADCPPGLLDKIDRLVERDLSRFVDGNVKRELDDLRRTILLWSIVVRVLDAGSFSKPVQNKLRDLFDEQTVEALRRFLAGGQKRALEAGTLEKLSASRAALQAQAPGRYETALAEVQREVEAFLEDLPGPWQKRRPAAKSKAGC